MPLLIFLVYYVLMVWNKYWTYIRCKKEALKFEYRNDFRKGSGSAYNSCHRNGWLDIVCEHMKIKGNRFSRAIYAFEFSDKSVYVGLTYNYAERYNSHMKNSKLIIKKTKKIGHIFVEFDQFMPVEEASQCERDTIEHYRDKGWKILNKKRGGGTGSSNRIWETDKIMEAVESCSSLKDFRDRFSGAIIPAQKLGIYKDCVDKLGYTKKPVNFWTKELIKEAALKYNSRKKFAMGESGAYAAAKKMGIYEEIVSHMVERRGRWKD